MKDLSGLVLKQIEDLVTELGSSGLSVSDKCDQSEAIDNLCRALIRLKVYTSVTRFPEGRVAHEATEDKKN
jgi:hypothetical protein